MDIQKTLANIPQFIISILNLFIKPKETIGEIKNQKWDSLNALVYCKLIALPNFIGLLIGHIFYWNALISGALILSLLLFVANFLGIYFFGLLLHSLAPANDMKKDPIQMVKLFAIAATPMSVIGIVNIYPIWPMMILTVLAAVYGWYLLYQGIPIFFKTTKETHRKLFLFALILFVVGWALLWGLWLGLDELLVDLLWPTYLWV